MVLGFQLSFILIFPAFIHGSILKQVQTEKSLNLFPFSHTSSLVSTNIWTTVNY